MRVLIGCERSGVVRRAFQRLGHEAYSCDLEPSDDGETRFHYQCDVFSLALDNFDLAIFHPPCTHLACSGARYFKEKRADGRQRAGIDFFMRCVGASKWVPKVAVENPVGIMAGLYRKPDQIIQPWQFGHPESKSTCLWLHGLPKLRPTLVLRPVKFYCRQCEALYYASEGPSGERETQCPCCCEQGRPLWNNQTPSGQNKLGPSKDRAVLRSRTYEGIAKAMAEQWGDQK